MERIQERGQIDAASLPVRRWWLAVLLFCGAVSAAVLSVWAPLLDRHDGRFVFSAIDDGRVVAVLETWWVAAVLAGAGLGGVGFLLSLFLDLRIRAGWAWLSRWVAGHPAWAGLVLLVMGFGAIDGYELFYDPYNKKHGLRLWGLREDIQGWLGLAAAVIGGLALSAVAAGQDTHRSLAAKLRWSLRRHEKVWVGVGVTTPFVAGTAMSLIALEGIPHFSDSLTYLMQGRILHSGRLWIDSPAHPDLFKHALFFIETDGRFYGKYPIGWPVVLGAFDRFGVGYVANAALASLAALLTGLVARRVASRRVAVLAAVLFGLSPWVWFNGANFASHVASTCAVMGFMWLFLRTLQQGGWGSALGAGLCLGAGVLIRPFDAAMFALPAVFVVLGMQIREPKRWLPLGTLIAIGALVGVGVYLWVNSQTTGAAGTSPYALEGRWDDDWNPTVGSILSRFHFQWAEFNGRFPGWGIGGITVALLGAVVAGRRCRSVGLVLLAVSTGLFFIGCTAFGFTNVWWGPRWLFPVAPLVAIMSAILVEGMLRDVTAPASEADGLRSACQLALAVLVAGLCVGLLGRYTGQFYQNVVMPPHKVSSAAHRELRARGIGQAVVAMPIDAKRPPLDPRAGMVYMAVPWTDNPVIYVRAIPAWEKLAKECYPKRKLYEVIADSEEVKGFLLKELEVHSQ